MSCDLVLSAQGAVSALCIDKINGCVVAGVQETIRSVCLLVSLPVCPFVFVCPSFCWLVFPSFCLFVCQSVCLLVSMSVIGSVWLYVVVSVLCLTLQTCVHK